MIVFDGDYPSGWGWGGEGIRQRRRGQRPGSRVLWVRTKVCERRGPVVEAKPGREAPTGVRDGAGFSIQLHDLCVLPSVATQGKGKEDAGYEERVRALSEHSTKVPCPPTSRNPSAQGSRK